MDDERKRKKGKTKKKRKNKGKKGKGTIEKGKKHAKRDNGEHMFTDVVCSEALSLGSKKQVVACARPSRVSY